jgi:hypothetical protein
MSTKADWVKHNIHELLRQVIAIYDHISKEPNRTRLGFGATAPGGIFLDNIYGRDVTLFETAVGVYDNPATHTPANLAALHTARENLVKSLRELYSGFLKSNLAVTDEDRVEMELPIPDRHPTPVGRPTSKPVIVNVTTEHLSVAIDFIDSESKLKAKPYGVHEAEISWEIFDAPKELEGENLANKSLTTVTPYIHKFHGEDRGKYFHFAIRWIATTSKAGAGDYCTVQNVIIP